MPPVERPRGRRRATDLVDGLRFLYGDALPEPEAYVARVRGMTLAEALDEIEAVIAATPAMPLDLVHHRQPEFVARTRDVFLPLAKLEAIVSVHLAAIEHAIPACAREADHLHPPRSFPAQATAVEWLFLCDVQCPRCQGAALRAIRAVRAVLSTGCHDGLTPKQLQFVNVLRAANGKHVLAQAVVTRAFDRAANSDDMAQLRRLRDVRLHDGTTVRSLGGRKGGVPSEYWIES